MRGDSEENFGKKEAGFGLKTGVFVCIFIYFEDFAFCSVKNNNIYKRICNGSGYICMYCVCTYMCIVLG